MCRIVKNIRSTLKSDVETKTIHTERGFTLLEVMLALAILGGVVITVITSLNYHIDVVERNKAVTTATLLARAKLEEIRISGVPGIPKGKFAKGFEGYSWEYAKGDSDFQGVAKVYLTVKWDGKEKVTIETYERGS